MTSPYVTKETRYFDMSEVSSPPTSSTTPRGSSPTRLRRISATSLMRHSLSKRGEEQQLTTVRRTTEGQVVTNTPGHTTLLLILLLLHIKPKPLRHVVDLVLKIVVVVIL